MVVIVVAVVVVALLRFKCIQMRAAIFFIFVECVNYRWYRMTTNTEVRSENAIWSTPFLQLKWINLTCLYSVYGMYVCMYCICVYTSFGSFLYNIRWLIRINQVWGFSFHLVLIWFIYGKPKHYNTKHRVYSNFQTIFHHYFEYSWSFSVSIHWLVSYTFT